jgi:hypothetical protein
MERRRHPRRAQSVMITESVVDSQEDLAKFKMAMVSVTILQFLRGVGGSLQTFEEGTWAAWLHDLLKPQDHKSWGLRSAQDELGVS